MAPEPSPRMEPNSPQPVSSSPSYSTTRRLRPAASIVRRRRPLYPTTQIVTVIMVVSPTPLRQRVAWMQQLDSGKEPMQDFRFRVT